MAPHSMYHQVHNSRLLYHSVSRIHHVEPSPLEILFLFFGPISASRFLRKRFKEPRENEMEEHFSPRRSRAPFCQTDWSESNQRNTSLIPRTKDFRASHFWNSRTERGILASISVELHVYVVKQPGTEIPFGYYCHSQDRPCLS